MKKILSLAALTICAYSAFAQEPPSKAEMDAVHACIADAGVEMHEPGEGRRPPKLTSEQKEIVDSCFEKNGVEPPKRFRAE